MFCKHFRVVIMIAFCNINGGHTTKLVGDGLLGSLGRLCDFVLISRVYIVIRVDLGMFSSELTAMVSIFVAGGVTFRARF
jgi:hypothetical protein